jgi:phosphatidate cytidylyltransferase
VSGLAGPAAIMAGVLTLGGIGALVSGNVEVIRKWRTWVVSAPLVTGCLWLGAPGAVLLSAGLGVTAAVEYGRLAKLRPSDSALIAATERLVSAGGDAVADATDEARARVVALMGALDQGH